MRRLFLIANALVLSLLCVAVKATPTFPVLTFIVSNVGSQAIYYSLAAGLGLNSNILCATVNGATVKEEVQGVILPKESQVFVHEALSDFTTICGSYTFSQIIALGLSADSALYNMNQVYYDVTFNTMSYTETPLTWYVLQSSNIRTAPLVNTDGIMQYTVDSDSSVFVY